VNRSRLAALSAGAMFLVASVLVPATALAAGTGTVSLSPATVSPTTGSTFTVTVTSQASTAMSGASAAIDFDKSKLQVISVSKGAGWNVAGSTWQIPSVGAIATANATGHLPSIAAYFTDGTSSVPANTPTVLATVSFFAYTAGTPTISITTSGGDAASIIDGAAVSYGSEVVTSAGGSTAVTISGTTANGQVTGDITGSVSAPTLALTCPASVTVPLVRNTTNEAPFSCSVASDGSWTLNVKDTNPDANHGRLVDGSQVPPAVLGDRLVIESAQFSQSLAGSPDLQPIFSGQQNVQVPLAFKQLVSAADKPGAYGMSVLFSIVNTF
jgi:hypothetical protein